MGTGLSVYGLGFGSIAAVDAIKLLKKHKPKEALGVGLISVGLLAIGIISALDSKKTSNPQKVNNNYNPQRQYITNESIFKTK